jgi:hypothetical protein
MNELSSFGTAEYAYPIKTVFAAARSAFALSNVYDLELNDEVGNRLILKSKPTLSSWGESIAIEFSSKGSKGTFVRVTSTYLRSPGKAARSGVNRNQKNVDFVLANISAQVAKSTSPKVSVAKTQKVSKEGFGTAVPAVPGNPPVGTLSKPALFGLLGGAVVIIVVMISFSQAIEESRQAATTTPAPSASATQNITPTEDDAPAACFDTETAVTMVRNVFSEGTATPAQVSSILQEAARMWASDAIDVAGSKKEWRLKMSELALAVDSYLTTSSPSDGETKFDQLFANMGLVENFC